MSYNQPGGGVMDQNAIQELCINPLDANHQIAASGAIDSTTPGRYVITKGSAAVLTLAAPIAGVQDGMAIQILSSTAFAHTITSIGNIQSGAAGVNTLTFAAFAGASVVLVAYNGKWIVEAQNAITPS
jgi:hypothetical protein